MCHPSGQEGGTFFVTRMTIMKLAHFCLCVFSLLCLAACASPGSTAAPPAAPPTVVPSLAPYPFGNSPAPTLSEQMVYPVGTPTEPSASGIVPFHLARPVVEGATLVTGTGPAGVPILLQDVTFMGAQMSSTVIGQDGKFAFQVAPLSKNHRIGICLADLSGTSWKPEDFSSQAYSGEEPMQVPQAGYYYDTTLVQGKP